MARGVVFLDIKADCDTVFDVVHDYNRRCEWDTLLRSADLLEGARVAARGVRSRCVGRLGGAFLPVETEYISFERGKLAAVKLTHTSILFERFAATIRHEVLGPNLSRVTYVYSVKTRPKFLRSLLEPLVAYMLRRATIQRLKALRNYIENQN